MAWGNNSVGQLDIPSELGSVVGIAVGASYSIALLADSTVRVWGNNSYGITNVPIGLSSVVRIFSGRNHCIAIRSYGSVIAWGKNWYGESNVSNDLGYILEIAAGDNHSMALVRLKNQTITGFNSIANQLTDFLPMAFPVTVTSGMPITYWVQNTLNGHVFHLSSDATLLFSDLVYNSLIQGDVNTILVEATQKGNNTYVAAEPVVYTFTVTKKSQTITGFNPIAD